MPSIRHADEALAPRWGDAIAVGPFPLARGEGFERHQHGEDQLAWTAAGALTVSTERSTWVLPRTRALWIPAGLPQQARVAHKTGNISTVDHDAGIVYLARRNPYVVVILTQFATEAGRGPAVAAVSKDIFRCLAGIAE